MGLRNLLEPQPESYAKKKAYNFHKVVGEGTFGLVKQATWTREDGSKIEVAVKCIEKQLVKKDPSIVYDEMEVLRGLDNPHIVKIHDYFESKDKYYLIFELAPGGELFERIVKRHHFSEHNAAECVNAVLDGVAYIHSKDICHRDLKPENLLLRTKSDDESRLDDIVIADFGVARHLTQAGEIQKTLVGSPGYGAPELYCKDGYKGKPADIWSIGVITYAMLCGTSPFKTTSDRPADLVREQMSGKLDFSREIWKNISDDAKDFITRCCDPKPDARPTAKELLEHPWLLHECKRSSHDLSGHVREEFDRTFTQSRALEAHEQENDSPQPSPTGISATSSEVAQMSVKDPEIAQLKNKMSAVEV